MKGRTDLSFARPIGPCRGMRRRGGGRPRERKCPRRDGRVERNPLRLRRGGGASSIQSKRCDGVESAEKLVLGSSATQLRYQQIRHGPSGDPRVKRSDAFETTPFDGGKPRSKMQSHL